MDVVALADFGSTMTKVALVDPAVGRLAGRAEAPATPSTDVMASYQHALELAVGDTGRPVRVTAELGASSVGGGLRMAAAGLVAELTAAAAGQAALNAGARLELVLHGILAEESAGDRLAAARPDILLFAGGTDGGQAELVVQNAEALAPHLSGMPVVVACNRDVNATVAGLFSRHGAQPYVVRNVLPVIGRTDVAQAQAAIRCIFISHVIQGKSRSKGDAFARLIRMPTPAAVLLAAQLMSEGSEAAPPQGPLVVVDVGGATTDVHSVVSGRRVKGASVPFHAARTVEGDLGLRASAPGVLAADRPWLTKRLHAAGVSTDLDAAIATRGRDPRHLPSSTEDRQVDAALAAACAALALARHVTPGGGREPRDLRATQLIIGTGGLLARSPDLEPLTAALSRDRLRIRLPDRAVLRSDKNYLLAAAGLLSQRDAGAASLLLSRELPVRARR